MQVLPSQLLRQLRRFLTVGSGALILDLGIYFVLSSLVTPIVAKAVSFIIATQFVFVCNKYWTFAETTTNRHGLQFFQFNTLYLITLVANITTHAALIYFTSLNPLAALLLASATSTIINFAVQRRWIFTTTND